MMVIDYPVTNIILHNWCISETYSSLAAAEQTVVEGHVVMIVVEVSRPLSFDTTVNILITPSNSSETGLQFV